MWVYVLLFVAVAYIVMPLLWEWLLSRGVKELEDSSSAVASGTTATKNPLLELQLQDLRAQRISETMIFVAFTCFLLLVCVFLWTNQSLRSASNSSNGSHSIISAISNVSGSGSGCSPSAHTGFGLEHTGHNTGQTHPPGTQALALASNSPSYAHQLKSELACSPEGADSDTELSSRVTIHDLQTRLSQIRAGTGGKGVGQGQPPPPPYYSVCPNGVKPAMYHEVRPNGCEVKGEPLMGSVCTSPTSLVESNSKNQLISSDVLVSAKASSCAASRSYDSSSSRSSKFEWFFKWHLLRNRNFMVIMLAHSISYFGSGIPDTHMYKYVEDSYPAYNVAWISVAYGITLGIGSILSGRIADRFKRFYVQLLLIASGMSLTAIVAVAAPAFRYIPGFWYPLFVNALFGLGDSGQGALYYVSIRATVPAQDLPQAVGLCAAVSGFLNMLGPPAGGIMFDYLKDYAIPFLLSGLMLQLSAMMFYMVDVRLSSSTGVDEFEREAQAQTEECASNLPRGRPP